MFIPFVDLVPGKHLRPKLEWAHKFVMSTGQFIGGDVVSTFEQEWADYVGTKHCVGVGSGSDALRFLVPRKDAALVPWNSRPTIDALEGWELALRPVDDETHNLKPCRGSVVVAVHLYGCPADVDEFDAGLLIEDCAQAHGAKYRGRMCGTLGDAAAWSFYPTKNLGAYGDAGAITTDSDEIAARIRAMRGARMDPLQAAFLRMKLPYLDGWNARRREIAEKYLRELDSTSVLLPEYPEWAEPCWHLFVIRHPRRDELKQKLYERGIETMIHYPGDGEVLSLPIGPHLTDEQVGHVIEAVNQEAASCAC